MPVPCSLTWKLVAASAVALILGFASASFVSLDAAEPVAPQFAAPVLRDVGEANILDIEAADFSGDGNVDLAILTNQGGSKVTFVTGDGTGNLQIQNTVQVPYATGMGAGDFNGDGILDLAFTQDSNKVSRDAYCDPPAPAPTTTGTMIFLGGGGASPQLTFKACLRVGVYLNDAVSGDFDNDGRTDLVVADSGARGARLYRGNGDGTFQTPINATGSGNVNVSAPIAARMNAGAGGQLDMLAKASGVVGRFAGNGTGGLSFSALAVGGAGLYLHGGVQTFAVADVNNDGVPDIAGVERGTLAAGAPSRNFFFVSQNGGTGAAYTTTDTHTLPSSTDIVTGVVPADFNKDGALDFAVLGQTDHAVYLYLGRGNGTFADGPVVSVGVEPSVMAVRDLNGDQWRDVAVVDRNHGNTSPIYTIQQIPGVGDATPPAVALSAPAPGTTVQGTVTISATATDVSGISKVEFLRNNIPIGTDTTAEPADSYGVPWLTTNTANGTYSLVARATDRFDNVSASEPVAVTIANPDATPPDVALAAPAANTTLSGTVTVAATATDFNGITKVEFYSDAALIGTALTAPFQIQWNTVGTARGSHTLTAKAFDPPSPGHPDGNTMTSTPITVTVDQPPTAAAGLSQQLEATSVNGATVTLSATGTDPDAGDVLAYRWSEGGTTLGTAASLTLTVSTGSHAFVLRVSDSLGLYDEDVVSVDVRDTTPPTVNVPADTNVEATSAAGAIAPLGLTATDIADPVPTVVCTPPAGTLFPMGTTPVSCTATDASGNASAPVTFSITVRDTTAPDVSIDLPGDGTVVFGVVPIAASAYDDVGVERLELFAGSQSLGVVVGQDAAALTWDASGIPAGTAVTLRATAQDAAGNVGQSAPIVVTTRPHDTVAPIVTVPSSITAEALSAAGAAAIYTATAVDNLDGALTPTCSVASGATFPLGVTTITCSATDAYGNTGSASFTVTVVDTTAPALSLPANISDLTTDPSGKAISFTTAATDVVDGAVPVICTPSSGSIVPVGMTTVTCSAADAHGNAAAGSFTIALSYATVPGPAVLLGPVGTVTSRTPVFSWAAAAASYYLLSVTDGASASAILVWYTPAQAGCAAGGTCAVPSPRTLASGLIRWQVLTWNQRGYGPWSPLTEAVIDQADPSIPAPSPIEPAGPVTSVSPRFVWSTVGGAIWYELSVVDASGTTRSFWEAASQVCQVSGCGATLPVVISIGPAQWKIRAWQATGAGAWSPTVAFSTMVVPPGKATLIAPTGDTPSASPTFSWTAQPGTSYYLVRVTGRSTVERWYRPRDAGCEVGAGACTVSIGPFDAGPASWRVLTWNELGYGPWSDPHSFVIDVSDPAVGVPQPLTTPMTTVTVAYPTYRWTPVDGAVEYRLTMITATHGQLRWWVNAVDACLAPDACSATPDVLIGNEAISWAVDAWTSKGHGPRNPFVDLLVNVTRPEEPHLVVPPAAITPSATFAWDASPFATWYNVVISDATGSRVNRWLRPSQVGCLGGTGQCTFASGIALTGGPGTLAVIAWSPGGYSPWSAVSFLVQP